MFENNNIDAYVIFDCDNRFYLTKIRTSFGVVVITKSAKYFFTDERYKEYATKELTDFEIKIVDSSNYYLSIAKVLEKNNSKKIGYENKTILLQEYQNLIKNYSAEYIPISEELEMFFSKKTSDQIYFMQSSQKVLEKALTECLEDIKIGITEIEFANKLENACKAGGAEKMSFDSIVAFGANSAMPHNHTTHNKLKKGDIMLFDIGCVVNGYCSDMTRTFAYGEVDEKLKNIYRIVYEAQMRALNNIKVGMPLSEIDSFAREYIISKGYSLVHSLGHGIGVKVHEFPTVKKDVDTKLLEGMVITIEPGIYVPDLGGVRIEDMIYAKKDEIINMTSFKKPKELTSII